MAKWPVVKKAAQIAEGTASATESRNKTMHLSCAILVLLLPLRLAIAIPPPPAQTPAPNESSHRSSTGAGQVETEELKHAEIRAQISPHNETTLSAEQPAKILQLTVRKGEPFKKGQLLVAFDCAVQQAQLQKAQAVAQGAHKTLEVNQRLAKLQSASVLEVELALAKMAEAQAEIAMNRTLLDKCRIEAPYSGRVVDLSAHTHQYLKVGDPIMGILDDSQLEVEAIVPSIWLRWLKTGNKFNLQVEETGKEYQVEIATLGAKIDPVSQSISLVGHILGQHEELLAGMSGKAIFTPR